MGLYDAILIKENHIALAGGLAKAVHAARTRPAPSCRSRSRCRDLDEVAYALGTGADRLLLDNMDPATLREAVGLRDEHAGGDGAAAGGLRRRHPRNGPRDRRDRRRLHLGRRPHPLGPEPRLLMLLERLTAPDGP